MGTLDKKISIVIPTRNEERHIEGCLDAIAGQDYPHTLIEIIVVDAHSTDATVARAQAWNAAHDIPVTVLTNDRIVAEYGKSVGLKAASGDYLCVLDCDEELAPPDLFSMYQEVLQTYPDIIGVEHHFLKVPGGGTFNNFLAVIHINDPLARQIATLPQEVEKRSIKGKTVRKLRISPAYPAMFFLRRRYVEPHLKLDTYEEGQVVLDLAMNGHDLIARIDGYGVYHYHVPTFWAYAAKRAKIALKHTTRIAERKTWVSFTGKRIYGYAFLNLTLIHPFLYAVYKAIREKEPLWLLWFPAAFLTTALYAANWVMIKVTGKRAW